MNRSNKGHSDDNDDDDVVASIKEQLNWSIDSLVPPPSPPQMETTMNSLI